MQDRAIDNAAGPEGLSTRQAARRQRVLDAALSLLELRDYERISVREVAESASVALATLYHYFPSKEQLFGEALVQWASSLGASVTTRPLVGRTPARRVEEALLRSVRAFERRPQLARLIGRLEMSEEPFARDVLARLDAVTTDVYLALLTDLPHDEAVRIVRVLDSVLDSSLRAWSSGRSSIRDVRRALSDAVALVLPERADPGLRDLGGLRGATVSTSTGALTERYALEDLRVLDYTDGIAGPYCSKLLADAGADVVKVEPDGTDPLRLQGSGALFEFLNASKRSVAQGDGLAPAADVIVSDPADVDRWRRANQAAVIVTITPFGRLGPWAGRPWTEFTLQAASGSTGQRGLPERPPLAAGGRIGEWAAGTFAAVAALAAHREARRSGHGEDIDVAILDCMAVTMVTYPSVFASFLGWPPSRGTGRTVEVPSIEPTSDGYFVVTTNSAQQFQDFLVMMGRPDLSEDHELAQVAKRFARREEFLRAVHRHTTQRTTSAVLEEAALFRLPAAPVLDAAGVLGFEQFRDRDVFVPSASGRFVQPRVPYRISGVASRAFVPAPAPGEHEGAVAWPARPASAQPALRPWRLPLAQTRVVDCTAWWAGPSATNILAALGADVIKVESIGRPDQMRLVSARRPPEDHWWEWGPIFHAVNIGKRGVTVDLGSEEGVDVFRRLLGTADVLLENYTPRVMEQFGLTWDSVHELNPELIMVRMPAFGLGGPWRDRTGFAQTMESVSGMAWRTGFPDGPPTLVRGACDPIAGMHAVIATMLALLERDRSGRGSHVESVMVEAALNVAAEQLVEFSASSETIGRVGNRGPAAAPQGVYRCAGDDRWVAIAVETDRQWVSLVEALGEPPLASAAQLAGAEGRHQHHDAIDRWLEEWTCARDAEDIVDELSSSGVPAEVVIAARDIVRNPQLRFRALFETEDHPVTGAHEVPMLPFRFAHVARWLRHPSPSLGQHNDEVLAELGVSRDEREGLRTAEVIGDRLAGT